MQEIPLIAPGDGETKDPESDAGGDESESKEDDASDDMLLWIIITRAERNAYMYFIIDAF